MRLGTRVRYATRAMVELASRHREGAVSIREISACQGVSRKYLEQLLSPLRTAGLVRSVRGPGGGYELIKPPEEITVRQIYEAIEGPARLDACGRGADGCDRAEECVTRLLWERMLAAAMDVLEETTLADLLEG